MAPGPTLSQMQAGTVVSPAGPSTPGIDLAEAVTGNIIVTVTWSSSGTGRPSGEKQVDSSTWGFPAHSVHGMNKAEEDEGGAQ